MNTASYASILAFGSCFVLRLTIGPICLAHRLSIVKLNLACRLTNGEVIKSVDIELCDQRAFLLALIRPATGSRQSRLTLQATKDGLSTKLPTLMDTDDS